MRHNLTPDFYAMVAAGMVPGVKYIRKFGGNSDVGVVPEDIWEVGGVYTGFSSEQETVEVFSGDANDADGDTGAHTVRIFGLETPTSTEYTHEDLTLNGTTPVTSTKTWWRVNRGRILTAGSSGSNEGVITCRHSTTTSNVFFAIPVLNGTTEVALWTVPHDNILMITDIRAELSRSGGQTGSGELKFQQQPSGGAWVGIDNWRLTNAVAINIKYTFPIYYEDVHDLRFRCTQVSNTGSVINAGFAGCYGRKKDVISALLSRASL